MRLFSHLAALSVTALTAFAVYTPYISEGGLGVSNTPSEYVALSDFDWQSIEWIELDLFNYGLTKFSPQYFQEAGLNARDRFLIEFMAQQEIVHATLLGNIPGRKSSSTSAKSSLGSESLASTDSLSISTRAAAQLPLRSITTEARQQQIFRLFEGLFPMPVWFEAGITQSIAWTPLAPYIASPRIAWQSFPALNITNDLDAVPPYNTSVVGNDPPPAITKNRSEPLSFSGRQVNFTWEQPGQPVGSNNIYMTNTTASPARFVAWISQLNTTYTPLEKIQGEFGSTTQPDP
ncbi:Protein rds1 [Leucoagaricus sp. SymC.cos]|nr:Protein rds1 [Leucoagaricus sp. SymC.cos]